MYFRAVWLEMIENGQLTQTGRGECPAGDIRTRRVEENAYEAGNQQLTQNGNQEGPVLDIRLAVA